MCIAVCILSVLLMAAFLVCCNYVPKALEYSDELEEMKERFTKECYENANLKTRIRTLEWQLEMKERENRKEGEVK